jgi:hypothetical protein
LNALNSSALPLGIEEEHAGLLADRAFEPDLRLDDELDACRDELVAHRFPFRHRQHQPKMAHRHRVTIDAAGCAAARFLRREISDDLVSVEVEVDPVRVRTAFGTSEHAAVERPRRGKIGDRKGKMKQWRSHERPPQE